MSRSASTQDRTDEIKQRLKSTRFKAEMALERWDGSAWVLERNLDSTKGIDINKSSKKYKAYNFALTPLPASVSFSILNKDGEYSEGSGTSLSGVYDLDTKIRVKGGYILDSVGAQESGSITLTDSNAVAFYMANNTGGYYELDETNAAGTTDTYFTDLFALYYDASFYDAGKYTPAAYYTNYVDLTDKRYYRVDTITVNCNNANGTIYYRLSDDLYAAQNLQDESTWWIDAGATTNGDTEITVNTGGGRYLQVAVVFDGVTWDDDIRINSIDYTYSPYIEWIYYDVFYLDTPEYTEPKAPQMPRVNCTARDSFKRAIETTIDTQDLSGGVSINQLIEEICDRIGIQYSSTSIDNFLNFGLRDLSDGYSGKGDTNELPKAIKIFENCMQVLNKTGSTYQMYMEYDSTIDDNILYVKPVPDTYAADFVFNYEHYESIGNQRKNWDKVLKRATIISDSQIVDKEEALGNTNATSAGVWTVSWSGDAEYKRISQVTNTGDGGDTTVSINIVEKTYIQFQVAGTSPDITLYVYGNKWNSAPDYEGEWINYSNMVNDKGQTTLLINPLLINDQEARDIVQGIIDDNGTPNDETKDLKYPYLNLLQEINDMVLLWARFVFRDDLRYITGMQYHWDYRKDWAVYNLNDSGLNFTDEGDFIYDRDQPTVSGNVIPYDTGFLYDMTHGVQATQAEAEAAYNTIRNVDF